MPAHQRVRTVIVALLGTCAVAVGAFALQAPMATAAPIATQVDFPFDGLGADDGTPSTPKPDEQGKKAEKLGGTVTTEVIDLVTGIVKCGLNMASPAVKCSL